MRARLRPHATTDTGDRLKLHRRRLVLAGREYTVVTPRPGTRVRFGTNRHHETWHLLSDAHGAKVLARLLWGLAYQRRPGTLILLDRPFLDTNPFDAAPADPIALVPAPLTTFGVPAARELRRRLPLRAPGDGTVRWHTHGLDGAAAAARARSERPTGEQRPPWIRPRGFQARVDRVGGLITVTATPEMLKRYAVAVLTVTDYQFQGMSWAELDWPDGEVQVFRDYGRRVSAARVARREILAGPDATLPPGDLDPLIWRRTGDVRLRRRG